jgi:hypothetical protein
VDVLVEELVWQNFCISSCDFGSVAHGIMPKQVNISIKGRGKINGISSSILTKCAQAHFLLGFIGWHSSSSLDEHLRPWLVCTFMDGRSQACPMFGAESNLCCQLTLALSLNIKLFKAWPLRCGRTYFKKKG